MYMDIWRRNDKYSIRRKRLLGMKPRKRNNFGCVVRCSSLIGNYPQIQYSYACMTHWFIKSKIDHMLQGLSMLKADYAGYFLSAYSFMHSYTCIHTNDIHVKKTTYKYLHIFRCLHIHMLMNICESANMDVQSPEFTQFLSCYVTSPHNWCLFPIFMKY